MVWIHDRHHIVLLSSFIEGDITKWMFEIDTNVFVGRMSARIGDSLWDRIVRTCSDGRAVMVYGVDNEQRFDFKTHNTASEPIDLDGLKLMMKPLTKKQTD